MVKLYSVKQRFFLVTLMFLSCVGCRNDGKPVNGDSERELAKRDSIDLPIRPSIKEDQASDLEANDFKMAHDTWYNGGYEEAIKMLRKFLKEHPNSSLADDSQRLIGTAYSNLEKYAKAIEELKKVEEKFPKSNSVPGSIYDRAHLYYYSLNNYDQAKIHYEKFVQCATIDDRKFRDIAVEHLNDWDKEVQFTKEAVKNSWRLEADSPSEYLEVVSHSWKKGGFGAVGLHDLSIRNKASVTYKDVIVSITYYSETDAILSQSKKVIYKYFSPKSTIQISDMNAGLVPADANRSTIEIVSATFVKK